MNKDKRLKRITIKIFRPGNKNSHVQVFNAGKGKTFLPGAIDTLLGKVCDALEKDLPGEEYKLVPVGPASFNIVHQGKTEAAKELIQREQDLLWA